MLLVSTISMVPCSLSANSRFLKSVHLRFLCASANANVEKKKEKVEKKKEWVRPTSPDQVSILGKKYNELLFKGRKRKPLGLTDLRKLLQECTLPNHVKYAVGAVQYYQIKGQDFSEDVNSLFIKACVAGDNPIAAAEVILKVSSTIFLFIIL